MGPRIIHGVRPAAETGADIPTGVDRRARMVIADSGAEAEVVVLPPGEAVGNGVQFHHRGTTWIITGVRRDSGILVAEPVAH